MHLSSFLITSSVQEGGWMNLHQWFSERQSRRHVLRQLGILTGAGLTLDGCAIYNPLAPTPTPTPESSPNSINHVLILCQENRTFDEYFGYYPKAGKFGVPKDYSQPDGKGGIVKPHHYASPTTQSPTHT